ncbi:uncharacterized protein GIQ15_05177 [Arthroderma uncinatum]|uniref:uncharacterized protein n=1 Tax=Arthroderma uncinatum TaxID=74035 RepID=UPI00144A7B3C|nr:uncharacterized protein GIQ15_05177 [Arthroderma uncinatum]KAF3482418.1 hypothetical protein GIQ15_05177 [Arthroderma uncinatum]
MSRSEEATQLFEEIERTFSSTSLGNERWYFIPIAALSGAGVPEYAIQLYSHLVERPGYATPEARQRLVRRIREALVKCVPIIGVCRPLEVIFGIAKIEKDEDKDYSFSREHWQSGEQNHERGVSWLSRIYQKNIDGIQDSLAAHKDFFWISTEITYGLYLSDHTILDDVETELVVLSGIMIQNLNSESRWHLRGMRRIGIAQEDVELVHQCIELVAKFAQVKIDRVPRVAEVEHEV